VPPATAGAKKLLGEESVVVWRDLFGVKVWLPMVLLKVDDAPPNAGDWLWEGSELMPAKGLFV
jgi:hypothetical protein